MARRKAIGGRGRGSGVRTKAPKRAGRPVEPGSLRQGGGRLELRIGAEELERYRTIAGNESLSDVVRRLLALWADGSIRLE